MHLQFPYGQVPNDTFFRAGMKDPNTQLILGDPPVGQWDSGFQQDLHALVLIADDSADRLNAAVSTVERELAGIANIVHREDGFILRNAEGEIIEHFGFRDGLSQPLFFKRDIDRARENSDFSQWDPRAPLSLALFKDSLGKTDESYGSFLVYRKLEQDVQGWIDEVVKVAGELPVESALLGAYAVGRFQDGTPVVLSPEGNNKDVPVNNFNYKDDPEGAKCPFHAHTRKTNPRGDTGDLTPTEVPLEEEKMHRIARRGISYGLDTSAQNYQGTTPPAPRTGSGLLFLCFQANYQNQFNFMQLQWANQSEFVMRGVGKDPVIGQGMPPGGQSWPTTWGIPEKKKLDFSLFVHMKGGEYFFAPSISFLQSLNPVQEKFLTAKHSGQALDVAGASQEDGANVLQWTKHGGNNQIWILEDAGDGYYFLVSKNSGKVLDVAGASQEPGANVLQWFKHGGDNQQWKLEDAGDGYSFVVAKHSGQVLDVAGASQEPGANVLQWPKHGGDNQKWQLSNA